MTKYQKFTDEMLSAFNKALESETARKTIEETKDASETNGRFKVVITTDHIDRYNEIVDMDGWETELYMKNPVVLWGHSHFTLPIGVTESLRKVELEGGHKGLVAEGTFASHEFAQTIRSLYDEGIIKATSVGFIAKEMEGNKITKAELLEFSFVSVPANAYALSQLGAERVAELVCKGVVEASMDFRTQKEIRGFVPENISDERAVKTTPWEAPTLASFTDEAWSELSVEEKERISKHFAYAPSADVKDYDFSELLYPHHKASDGTIVYEGVSEAMKDINGSLGADMDDADRRAVYLHLKAHFEAFGEEAPALKDFDTDEEVEETPDETPEEEKSFEEKVLEGLAEIKGAQKAIVQMLALSTVDIDEKEAVEDETNPEEHESEGGEQDGKEFNQFTYLRSALRQVNNIVSESLAEANKDAKEHYKSSK